MLLAAADDYLLELARTDLEAHWRELHPDGEVTTYDTRPAPLHLTRELSCPSLFAPARLLVVRDAGGWVEKKPDKKKKGGDAAELAGELAKVRLADATLVLVAEVEGPPEGPLVEVVRRIGEVRYTPLPEAPKPWDVVRMTTAQRAILESLVKRAAPELVANREVMDALCEAYGFKPRDLVQAAQRAALTGTPTAELVRQQAGITESTGRDLEEALLARKASQLASTLGRLAAGGVLVGWRGEAVEPRDQGGFLVRLVGRLLRQAVAMRGAAGQAGMENELKPGRCADPSWYPRVFKPTLLPRLQDAIAGAPDSGLSGLTPWQLQRVFRLAAPYSSAELLSALDGLARAEIDREGRSELALAALSGVLLALVRPPAAGSRAAAG